MATSPSVSSKDSDELIIKPLGAGQEVGRSCIMLQFKGKTILLDMGIHPGHTGFNSLPYLEQAVLDKIDLLLITHFHLDHCGGLPYFLNHTTFRGKCFMTHATKAIYRWMMADFLRVSTSQHNAGKQSAGSSQSEPNSQQLFDEHDLERSMDRIEAIDFHEELEHNGIRFTAYIAGHVLGAAQFLIEIAGIKVLYTGDFSCAEDRHLCAAEVPPTRPDVIIMESTYGTRVHDSREVRERRFLNIVHRTINKGGKCLIPCFALGRAQELQLILDEYWSQHPELQDVPIYYASALATKCMNVYKTYTSSMNDRVKRRINLQGGNPFDFKFIQAIRGRDDIDADSPCVVLASPGMLQSGLSRQLLDAWCPDPRNTCIIAGYCVEGTPAKHLLTDPPHITGLNGNRIERKCEVHYISFSAHTDYEQTKGFLQQLRPNLIVLVHGQSEEMHKLRKALIRDFQGQIKDLAIFMPANGKQVVLRFRTEKSVKVLGSLATRVRENFLLRMLKGALRVGKRVVLFPTHTQQRASTDKTDADNDSPNSSSNTAPPPEGTIVQGIVIRKNFQYILTDVDEVGSVANIAPCEITQKVSVRFEGDLVKLTTALQAVESQVDWQAPNRCIVMGCVTLVHEKPLLYVEWTSSTAADMLAMVAITCALGNTATVSMRDAAVAAAPDVDLRRVDHHTSLEPVYKTHSAEDDELDAPPAKRSRLGLSDFEYERFWTICQKALCDRYGEDMVDPGGDLADGDERIGEPLVVKMMGGLHTMRVDLRTFAVTEAVKRENDAAALGGSDAPVAVSSTTSAKLKSELSDIIGQLFTALYPIDMWCHAPASMIEPNIAVAPSSPI